MGTEHPDDAAVLRLPGGDLLVQTVDLIAPIVDDPRTFGRIAAANSLSDVYAMGGRPFAAMSVACFPSKALPMEVFREILAGALDALREAKAALVGGHTVEDPELKYGLSVSGLVEPDVWSIDKARSGDVLLLTKPLGTGVVNRALRKDAIGESSPVLAQAVASMTTLNEQPMRAGRLAGAHAATDVTGFGLLGHAAQFARASNVTFEIRRAAVPVFDGVPELLAQGLAAARCRDNGEAYRERIEGIASDDEAAILFDPQTSGGLLLAIPETAVDTFLQAMRSWPFPPSVIGRVASRAGVDVRLQ